MQYEGHSANLANPELLSAFVEHAPAAVAMLDRNLRYLLTSRRWLMDYAVENQDLIGREHPKVFPLLLNEQTRVGEWESIAASPPHSCTSSYELRPHLYPLERWQKIYALCLAGETQRGDSDYFIKPNGSLQRVKWEIQPWHTRSGEIGGIIMFTEFQESYSLTQMSVEEDTATLNTRDAENIDTRTWDTQDAGNAPERSSNLCTSLEASARFSSGASAFGHDSGNGYHQLRETASEGIWGSASLTNTIEQLQQEIVERKQTQALLKESEERYRSLIAAMAEGIILQDANGIIHTCNAAAEGILGISAEQLMGQTFNDPGWLVIKEDGEPIPSDQQPLNVTLCTGQSFTNVVIGIYKSDGNLTWLSLNSQPLFRSNESTPYAAVASFIDITKRKQIGVALRESEERFRATFEQAAVGISHAELDGSFVRVNQKFCDIVGYTREELLEQKFQDITHPDDLEVDREYVRSLLAGDIETYSLEKRYLRKDGELIWGEVTASLVRTSQGTPKYFLFVVRDISDRKAAEAVLREREAQLQNRAQREELLNRLSNQIRNSLDLNTILETAVQEIRQMLQIDRCQFAWYCPHERRDYWEVVKEARNPDLPSRTGRYPTDLIAPITRQLLNLEIFQVDNVTTLGNPIYRSFIKALGCTSVLSLPMQTPSGTIGVINCIHSSEARPWSVCEVELLKAVQEQLLIAINQAELYAASHIATQQAQEKATQLEQALNELRRTQAQLIHTEKMSSLGQLVAGVAHEINNPVNFIYGNLIHAQGYFQDLLGLVELYRGASPNPPTAIREYIEAIDLDFLLTDLTQLQDSMRVGAERIREIVRSLRTFSRLDESDSKAVDIHTGIESTLMILQSRFKGKPTCPPICVIKEYGNLPLVECYPGQLNQVFMNLLTNAIDALEEKNRSYQSKVTGDQIEVAPQFSPTIVIATGVVHEDNREQCESEENIHVLTKTSATNSPTHVFIRIADNGLGMSEKTQQQLFDPFFTTKPVGKGTGLGLAISYQIVVEKHGGRLWCHSAPGQGAEFVVEIPIRHCQEKS